MDEGSQLSGAPDDGQNLYHPDQVITPTAQPIPEHGVQLQAPATNMPVQPPAPPASQPEPPVPVAVSQATTPAPEQSTPAQPAPISPEQPEVDTTEDDDIDADAEPELDSEIHWTASEFIANQKSRGWYMMLGVAALIIGLIVWLLTRDLFPSLAVFVGVLLLGIYGARQPREESYSLDEHGITIGARHYGYDEFRSFAVVQDGAFLGIELAPLRRFALDTTIYVAPDDEDQILDHLSQYLPMEEAKTNITDSLMRRIRF